MLQTDAHTCAKFTASAATVGGAADRSQGTEGVDRDAFMCKLTALDPQVSQRFTVYGYRKACFRSVRSW
jgi:hypothetical protein